MDKSKKVKLSQINPYIETQNLATFAEKTGNLYKALYIISRRANQISRELKEELHNKLKDFESHDTYEEFTENREQIEISKFYERLPHPTLIATHEFLQDEIYYRENESQSN
ncbi:MAG: DNA-directed RNA polymerase subunit omega [Chitinophagales bacterium]|nr:DNA-directed RNA polymerase subunit omega [Chitinophagales bacterium]